MEDGYRYTVGIKAADMETLIKVANRLYLSSNPYDVRHLSRLPFDYRQLNS